LGHASATGSTTGTDDYYDDGTTAGTDDYNSDGTTGDNTTDGSDTAGYEDLTCMPCPANCQFCDNADSCEACNPGFSPNP